MIYRTTDGRYGVSDYRDIIIGREIASIIMDGWGCQGVVMARMGRSSGKERGVVGENTMRDM